MNFLKVIGGLFVALFKKITGKTDDVIVQLPDNIHITPDLIDHCINVVNNIKSVINNPVLVLVTDLTPISLDNTIRLKIADSLPPILAGLTYSKELLANADNNAVVNQLLDKIRLSDDPDKDALYHALAARLIMIVSDGKVSWSEAVGLIELYFKQIFSAPKAAISPVPVFQAVSTTADVAPKTTVAPLQVAPLVQAVEAPAPILAVSETLPDDLTSVLAGGTRTTSPAPVSVADTIQATMAQAVTNPIINQ